MACFSSGAHRTLRRAAVHGCRAPPTASHSRRMVVSSRLLTRTAQCASTSHRRCHGAHPTWRDVAACARRSTRSLALPRPRPDQRIGQEPRVRASLRRLPSPPTAPHPRSSHAVGTIAPFESSSSNLKLQRLAAMPPAGLWSAGARLRAALPPLHEASRPRRLVAPSVAAAAARAA